MSRENPSQSHEASGKRFSRRSFLTLAGLTTVEVAAGTALGIGGTAKGAADKSVAKVLDEPTSLAANRAKADQIGRELGGHITGAGRNQLSLDGLNPDLCFNQTNILGEALPHPNHTYSEQLTKEINTSRRLIDSETGQRLNTIVANSEGKFDARGKLINSDEAVTVYFGAYRNEVNYRESNYRVAEIAHQMSDRVLFAFDVPNMGDSDSLTGVQQEGLAEGTFAEVVDAHLRVLAEKGVKKINLAGFSMGARVALTTAVRAAAHEIEVENLLLYEAPGIDNADISLPDLLGRYAEDNKYLDLYHSNHFDNTLFEAAGMDRPQIERIAEQVWFPLTNFADDPWILYARVLAQSTVEAELEQVFKTTKANVLMGNAEKSKLCPIDDVFRIRNRFKQQYGSRIGINIMEGVGHYAFAHPKDLAFNMKLNLENQPIE